MTYFFETYGCQMNIAESAAVEQKLIARGWEKASSGEVSDLVIINTCSVRATAENRIFGRLGFYAGVKSVRSGKPDAKVRALTKASKFVEENGIKPVTLVVMGCMAERLLESFKKDYPVVDYVVGTFAKQHIDEIFDKIEKNSGQARTVSQKGYIVQQDEYYKFPSLSLEPGAFTSFVPIMNGCNNFCSYCIVPYVRGREISRPAQAILDEITELSKHGVKEITLLGQNVNSYRDESSGETILFPALMEKIALHLEAIKSPIGWVRFESSHPKDLSDELLEVMKKYPVICRHIHLPVQHGSSKVLKEMNRRYTREHYLGLVAKIREALPDASLTTDIMLGFPGETEEDFEQAMSLMREVGFKSAFMYYYNTREGTPAAERKDQIPLKVKKERLQKIIDQQLVITQQEMNKRVGQTVMVLCESVSRDNKEELLGKTTQDEHVAFVCDKSKIGEFVTVHLDSLNGNTYKGTLVN